MPRIYKVLDSAFCKMLNVVTYIHQGFWLGCFGSRSLQEITRLQYQSCDTYFSESHNRSGLMKWERGVLNQFFTQQSTILVAAAGGGREIIALHDLGHVADGFDCLEELVSSGRRLLDHDGIRCKFEISEPGCVPNLFNQYDAIIVGWGGYMHIPGKQRRIDFLRQLHEHSKPGAPIMLSFFTRTGTSTRFKWIERLA
ncbi:class I SAM-dependent methyltransferase, partial [Gammaproteobacteria bacterium]|nr:class I SAM-dependent methyltransferase [Gammaproteobacteria bacterium]